MSRENSKNRVFANEIFAVEQSAACPIPGYLVLRLKGEETSLAALAPEKARALGDALARTAAAIERATGAERVYVLSFCEIDPRLHFHLFPRTAWLLKEYFKANFNANEPVDGPLLFAWARNAFGPGSHAPRGAAGVGDVRASIAAFLEGQKWP